MTSRPEHPECRRFLAEVVDPSGSPDGHALRCEACRAKVSRIRRLVTALAMKPLSPPELSQAAFLESIYERAVDRLESAAADLGVRHAVRAVPGDSLAGAELFEQPNLRKQMVVPPASLPSAQQWARLRTDLVATGRASSPRLLGVRRLVLAGFAASAIAYASFANDRPSAGPEVVFIDLDARPQVEFAVVRGGALR